jgi:hypothetical protein
VVIEEPGTVSTNGNGVELAASPGRVCPVCHGPVPDRRRTTCSSSCAVQFKGRDRPKAKPPSPKPVLPAVTPAASPTPAAGLAAAVAALVGPLDQLGGIRQVTIELAAQVVTITQA